MLASANTAAVALFSADFEAFKQHWMRRTYFSSFCIEDITFGSFLFEHMEFPDALPGYLNFPYSLASPFITSKTTLKNIMLSADFFYAKA